MLLSTKTELLRRGIRYLLVSILLRSIKKKKDHGVAHLMERLLYEDVRRDGEPEQIKLTYLDTERRPTVVYSPILPLV